YATVLPGRDGAPVQFRGVSPRHMSAFWEEDDDVWPVYAVEKRRNGWRLYDGEYVYFLQPEVRDDRRDWGATRDTEEKPNKLRATGRAPHPAGVCPVIRYRDTDDLDDPVIGLV